MRGLRAEKEPGELSGCHLEANLGQFAGVMAADQVHEVVLMEAKLERVLLGQAPLAVSTMGLPIGNIALSDLNADLFEGTNDFVLRDIVKEHPVDHIAHGFGQASNFAVARLAVRFRGEG